MVNYDSDRNILGETDIQARIRKALELIPEKKRMNRAGYYLAIYRQPPVAMKRLKEIYAGENDTLASALQSEAVTRDYIEALESFLSFCAENEQKVKDIIRNSLVYPRKYPGIIKMRSEGVTYSKIAEKYEVSIHNIYSTEKDFMAKFLQQIGKQKMIQRILADRNGYPILSPDELSEYCGTRGKEVVYLLKSSKSEDTVYSKELDVFLLCYGKEDLARAENYIRNLPEYFDRKRTSYYVHKGAKETGLPVEIIRQGILAIYHKQGPKYTRVPMKKNDIYQDILNTYYQDGIRVRDPDQIKEFRAHVIQVYGNIELDEDKGIGRRIVDNNLGILCDRGTYKPKQEKYIPLRLTNRIESFVRKSKLPVIPYKYLYQKFEADLQKAGVDNPYYLQGILGELFKDQFIFRKDYVSTHTDQPSVQKMIHQMIHESKLPISDEKILAKFQGINPLSLRVLTNHPDILKYTGCYYSGQRSRITEKEIPRIKRRLKKLVTDRKPHHSRELYDLMNKLYAPALKRNHVTDAYGCFSLLAYWFGKDFQFVRPYIALRGIRILTPKDQLKEFLRTRSEIEIHDLAAFVRENDIRIPYYLRFADENNSRFLLVTNRKMVTITKIGINKTKSKEIEKLITPHVHGTMAIRDLPCFTELPQLKVPWSDWLVYSVIKKWGTSLDVGVSTHNLKTAVPLIAPKGQLDLGGQKWEVKEQDIFSTDDLNNLDALLEEMIEWEDLEMDQ